MAKGKTRQDLIRQRFRELALRFHPDLNPDDPRAAVLFQGLVEWRDNALDRADRADAAREQSEPTRSGDAPLPPDVPDRRESARATARRIVTIDLPFDDAARGVTLRFSLRNNRVLELAVRAGIENNHVATRLARRTDGTDVELVFEIRIAKHHRYWRQGSSLLVRMLWTDRQTMAGDTLQVPTPFGVVPVPVPRYKQRGDIIRVPGKGLPSPTGRGDLLVELADTTHPPRTRLGLLD